jgi:DNA polymerase I
MHTGQSAGGFSEFPDEWFQVGADMSSLEARCLAHYMARYDGGAYGKLLLEGDVHAANRDALGLPKDKAGRGRAKTWLYAFMYGAGDEKLGTILDPSLRGSKAKAAGKKYKDQFFAATPAMAALIEDVKKAANKNRYLTLPDGRKVYVRSDHSALNFLLQGAGAVLCKWWVANSAERLERELGPQGWDKNWAGMLWVHDEVQLGVRARYVEQVKTALVEEARKLTQQFNWRVPLDGEAKHGKNWKETH